MWGKAEFMVDARESLSNYASIVPVPGCVLRILSLSFSSASSSTPRRLICESNLLKSARSVCVHENMYNCIKNMYNYNTVVVLKVTSPRSHLEALHDLVITTFDVLPIHSP